MTAYAIELGVMDGSTFVPFDGKYSKVKTFDELVGRAATSFPAECNLELHFWVDSN